MQEEERKIKEEEEERAEKERQLKQKREEEERRKRDEGQGSCSSVSQSISKYQMMSDDALKARFAMLTGMMDKITAELRDMRLGWEAVQKELDRRSAQNA